MILKRRLCLLQFFIHNVYHGSIKFAVEHFVHECLGILIYSKSKKEGKDQESIQLNTTLRIAHGKVTKHF